MSSLNDWKKTILMENARSFHIRLVIVVYANYCIIIMFPFFFDVPII